MAASRIKHGFIAVLAAAGLTLGFGLFLSECSRDKSAGPHEHDAHKEMFTCPMHPGVVQDHPGQCPICGMNLVPMKDEAPGGASKDPGLAPVTIDPARQQLIGLVTAPAERKMIAESWRTVGTVAVDERRVRRVSVKIEGFVERIHVNYIGQPVAAGDPLFALYSPSLLNAENEYVIALETRESLAGGPLAGQGESLAAAARRKLELWDVPRSEISRLARTRRPARALTFYSPIAGVVTAKDVVEGSALMPGDAPYEITDLSEVWVMADVYESDLARVTVGMAAELALNAYPGRAFEGKIEFVAPLLASETRTVKVRMSFENPAGELKPGMYGDVTLRGPRRETLTIPVDAVVRAGARDVVFLALPEGKFEPREVMLGLKSEDRVEVVSGLSGGQMVVTRANFLIDSESQLRAALSALGGK